MSLSKPWLVIGLGNPGPKYTLTRHNVGYLVVDILAERMGGSISVHPARCKVLDSRLGTLPGGVPGPRTLLATPGSYMNESGGPVKLLMEWAKIVPENLLVIHDDIDLPPHTLKLKVGGGEGGHNGIKSISRALGTQNYARLRVGIGRPPGRKDAAEYVLEQIPQKILPELEVTLMQAADVVEQVILSGLPATQMELHTKR